MEPAYFRNRLKNLTTLSNRRNLLAVGLTAFILAAIPITSILVNNAQDPRSGAATSPYAVCNVIGAGIPSSSNSLARSTPLEINLVPGGTSSQQVLVDGYGGPWEPGVVMSKYASTVNFKSINGSGGAIDVRKGIIVTTNQPSFALPMAGNGPIEYNFKVPPTAVVGDKIIFAALAINYKPGGLPVALCTGDVTIRIVAPTAIFSLNTQTISVQKGTTGRIIISASGAGKWQPYVRFIYGSTRAIPPKSSAYNLGGGALMYTDLSPNPTTLTSITKAINVYFKIPNVSTIPIGGTYRLKNIFMYNRSVPGVNCNSSGEIVIKVTSPTTSTSSPTCSVPVSSISISKGSTGSVNASFNIPTSTTWAPGYRSIENTLNSVGPNNERASIGGGNSGLTVSPASYARITGPKTGTVSFQFYIDNVPEVSVGGTYTFKNLVLINVADSTKVANCTGVFTINVTSSSTSATPTPTSSISSASCQASKSSISIAKGSTGSLSVNYSTSGSGKWAPGFRTIDNVLNSVGPSNQRALMGGGQSGLTVSPSYLARISAPSTGTVNFVFYVDNVPEVQSGGKYTFSNLVLIFDDGTASKVVNCSGQFVINVL